MELKDTVPLMLSSDYKDRFKAEYYQTKIRFNKLNDMLEKYRNHELDFKPTCDYDTLNGQCFCMKCYLNDLTRRAEIENISLS